MCIVGSVGSGGKNASADVKRIQLMLNLCGPQYGLELPLIVDGGLGKLSLQALTAFQQRVCISALRSCVEPDDDAMRALKASIPKGFGPEKLRAIMINATPSQIDRYYQPLVAAMARNDIDSPLRMAHFLAQLGHESGDLRYCEEIADGRAYEGRVDLGNTVKGDGPLFKGRGLIQLTGRANYRSYGLARGRDFLTGDNPRLLALDPELAVDVAAWFWTTRGLNAIADADDLRLITRRINGGYNGLDDREMHLKQAKWFLL